MLKTALPAYEILRTEALIPYARNPRMHSEAQVGQIAAAIREWGFTNPVLVDEKMGLIAGHGRLQAALKLGMEEVPAIVLRGLFAAQKRAFVLGQGSNGAQPRSLPLATRALLVRGARHRALVGRPQADHALEDQDPQGQGHGHSTQKPVECMRRPMENNSSPGHAVYEPFCGSGTALIAAEMTGRARHAIEVNPTYVDVAMRRWQSLPERQLHCTVTGGRLQRSRVAVADWQPSDADARQIETMAGYGLAATDIATIVGVDPDLLEQRCRLLMASGVAKANAKVAQAIDAQASSGANLKASIEWAKLRMGWHDSDEPDQKQAEGDWKSVARAAKRKGRA